MEAIISDVDDGLSQLGDLARRPETIRLLEGRAEGLLIELAQPDWRLLGINESGFEVAVDDPTGERRSIFFAWSDFEGRG